MRCKVTYQLRLGWTERVHVHLENSMTDGFLFKTRVLVCVSDLCQIYQLTLPMRLSLRYVPERRERCWWELGLTWKKLHFSCQRSSLCSDADEREGKRLVMQVRATVSSKEDISWPQVLYQLFKGVKREVCEWRWSIDDIEDVAISGSGESHKEMLVSYFTSE